MPRPTSTATTTPTRIAASTCWPRRPPSSTSRPRKARPLHRRAAARDDRVHPWDHRVDEPRRVRLGSQVPPGGRRDPPVGDGAPLEHRPVAARTGATGAILRYLPLTDDGLLDLSDLGSYLTERTKLLAITGMSNSLDLAADPRAGRRRARRGRAGARGRRTARAARTRERRRARLRLPHDQRPQDARPDGFGGLFAKLEHLEAMDPFLGGGHMIEEVFPDHSTWNEVPYKFEAGTMNLAQEVGLGAAIDYLEGLGMDACSRARGGDHGLRDRPVARGGSDDHRTKDVSVRGGAGASGTGHPPARPRDGPERGGRRDPRGSSAASS